MGVPIDDLSTYNSITNIDFGEMVIIFKFGADWCKPCVELGKTLIDVPNSLTYDISIDNENFASFFIENSVYTIPDTIIKYKCADHRFQGLKTLDEINTIIDGLKNAV